MFIKLFEKLDEAFKDTFQPITDEEAVGRIESFQKMKLIKDFNDIEKEAKLGGWKDAEDFLSDLGIVPAEILDMYVPDCEDESDPVGKLSMEEIDVAEYFGTSDRTKFYTAIMNGWIDSKGNIFVDEDLLG